MKARSFLLVLLLSMGGAWLGAKDVPSDAKTQLTNAWRNYPALSLKALRLLVNNTAQREATPEPAEQARADALGALREAQFTPVALLNEAFRNPDFRDWLAGTVINPPTTIDVEKDYEALVDCIYDQVNGDGITKLGDVTRTKAAYPDSPDKKDPAPLVSLLDAVPPPQPGNPNPLVPTPVPKDFPAICQQSYANQLDAFRAAYALKDPKWSIFNYIGKKINGSESK